jgi:hypothetical protein
MSEAQEHNIIFTLSEFKFDDGSKKDRLYGYALYKKMPIAAVGGWRIKPDPKYKFNRFSISFAGSDKSRKEPIEGNYALIKEAPYSSGTKYSIHSQNVDDVWLSGYNPLLFDIVTPMAGWVSEQTVENKWKEECNVILMKFDDYRFDNTTKKDNFKLVDMKNDLTMKQLEEMKEKQFPYFDDFMKPIIEGGILRDY